MKLLLSCLVILLRISSLLAFSNVDCTFETDQCGWQDINLNTWFRTNSSTVDPGHDHTCVSSPGKCGTWLSTITNFTRTQEFVLVSPKVTATPGPMCFRFWYHFFGLAKNLFEVQVNGQPKNFNAQTIWAKRTPQSNNWIQGFVTIPKQNSDFYIIFHAALSSMYHDDVGLDDITLLPGACPATPDCDLETDLCSWTTTGAVRTNGTPITRDHTTGIYLGHYLLSSGSGKTSQVTGSVKNLTSTLSNNFYSYCLKFWYYFNYNDNSDQQSYIEVNISTYTYMHKKLIIPDVISDALLNDWQPFFFTVPNPRNTAKDPNVIISMYTASPNNQIAIDDLLVQNRPCETSGDCDFESDFCGWNNGKSGGLWLRSTGGGQKGFKKAPRTDTTTHTPNGWFAIIPTEFVSSFISASLTSPPLYARSGYSCLSLMYYAVGNSRTPVLTVTLNDLTNRNQPFSTSVLNATTFAMWNRFTLSLPKMPVRYSITIRTNYQARSIQSDIAIDDIKLNSAGCNVPPWRPSSTTPIPYVERKWDCNFEGTCSQWTFDPQWAKTSYRKAPSELNVPRSDHTLKTPEGRYLLWMPTSSPDANQTQVIATLNSTVLSAKEQHCLSFWYYDSSEIQFELDVYIRSKSAKYAILPRIVRPNIATRSWKIVKVDIRSYYNDPYISLRFKANPTLNGTFAIDDIKVVPTVCGHLDDYVYTFDSMDNLEVSRITPLNSYMGTLHYYGMQGYPNAPDKDHTTGTGSYFLFMNRPTDPNTIWNDYLTLTDLPAMRYYPGRTENRCFRFAYQLSGNASLNVYIASLNSNSFYNPSFTAFAPHTNWVIAQVPYLAYYEHKLVFAMSKPMDKTSYIAIDDLSVSSRNCKQPVECDFDDDVCAYTSRYAKADYDFARFVGPPQNSSWPGPAYDHTKRGYGGGYLYMTGYPSKRDATRYSAMQTPVLGYRYNVYSNYCISLWSQVTQPDAVLTITLGLFGGKDPNNGNSASTFVKLMELTNLTESKWSQHYTNIDQKLFTGYHEFTLQISAKTTKANTVVAIDDIELSRSACDYKFAFTCANKQGKVYADKLCNFYNDCNDGSDEKNCGECNFESDTCGWLNQPTIYSNDDSSGRWVSVSAQAGLGPKVDGNGNANGHYLLLSPASRFSKSMFISATTLTRNYKDYMTQFKDAYFTCSMTFDYYVYSTQAKWTMASLSVRAGYDVDSAVLKGYYRTSSDGWQKGTVFVGGYPGSFVIQFFGSRYAANETIALDNIQFHNCSVPYPSAPDSTCPASGPNLMCKTTRICIDPSDQCDFEDNCGDNWDENFQMCQANMDPKVAPSCAFEKSLEFCGFVESVNTSDPTVFNWQFAKGYDFNMFQYSGPTADHTTKDHNGQFLTLRSYNTKNMGKKVQIYSPMVYSDGGDCYMRFFYYNNGNYSEGTNTLKVWVQFADGGKDDSDTLFKSNSYLPNWIKAKVHYDSSSPFRFVFEGQLAATRGSISLDDVSFSGTCMSSNAKRTPGSGHSSAVTVILIILLVGLVAGLGYFLFRKHQNGELVPYIDRITSMLPSKKTDSVAFVNANYNEPSTSSSK